MIEIHLDKDSVVLDTACTGWNYDEAKDVTLFHLRTGKVLSAKGNWIKRITTARARGLVGVTAKRFIYRQ